MSKKVLLGWGCPECKSQDFYYDEEKQETSCKQCGLVLLAKYHHYGIVLPGLKPIYISIDDTEKNIL